MPFSCSLPGATASLPIFSMAPAGSGGSLSSAVHLAWPSAVVTAATGASPSQSMDVAHLPGFGSVPPKLIKKIVANEYVDIWELLPETWQVEMEGSCCHTKRPRRSLVTDVHVWTECFATMAAILTSAFPTKAPHCFCLSPYYNKGQPHVRELCLGVVRHGLSAPSGQPWLARLGYRRPGPLQRGVCRTRQTNSSL